MEINFMLLASPLFVLLIILECLISFYKKSALYQLNDAINNVSSGILEEIGSLPVKGLILFGYYYFSEHFAFFQINTNSILNWFILFLAYDCSYYWYHRASHRNNFFWIGHSVHHQSEHYNFAVALRQGYFQTLTSWMFYLPLAIIGFPLWMFVTVASLDSVYQFCLHTQYVKKLGWFEKIFNTPSHHRVHHGRNPQYIDKNYAGILIIWDKLFGTFEAEDAPVEYGVTEPLDSWNPFYANIKVIKDILYYGKSLKNRAFIILAFFMPPEWIIKKLEKEGATVVKRNHIKPIIQLPRTYMLINIIFTVALYVYLSSIFNLNSHLCWLIGSIIFLNLYLLGRITAGNKKTQLIEITRASLLSTGVMMLSTNLLLSSALGLLFYSSNYLLYNLGTTINDSASNTLNSSSSKSVLAGNS